jgi:hypothetical protein
VNGLQFSHAFILVQSDTGFYMYVCLQRTFSNELVLTPAKLSTNEIFRFILGG